MSYETKEDRVFRENVKRGKSEIKDGKGISLRELDESLSNWRTRLPENHPEKVKLNKYSK